YLALGFLVVLSWDVWKALWFEDPATGKSTLGLGAGPPVLPGNVTPRGGYRLSLHSLRRLAGGCRDEPGKEPLRRRAYGGVSCLNRRHMLWAWMSLFWVAFSDVYVRMLSLGIWSDWRIF